MTWLLARRRTAQWPRGGIAFCCLFLYCSVADLTVWGGLVAEAATTQAPEAVVVEVRVHGNYSIPDDEVLGLAGVSVGTFVTPAMMSNIQRRLDESGRFESVEIRKRYLSLTATDKVALIVVVAERSTPATSNPVGRVFGELGNRALFLPILDYTEGYGVSFGAQTSLVDLLGANSRVSVPATWGGTRQVGVVADRSFASGPIHRVQTGISLVRRENPHVPIADDRTRVWARVDRRFPGKLRVAGDGEWADIRFGVVDGRLTRFRVSLDLDTRQTRSFPRDSVFLEASHEWLDLSHSGRVVSRPRYRAEVYKGLLGQSVLAVRADYLGSDGALPLYEKPLLGGGTSLRGWRVGELIGDRRVTGSVEMRFPLGSALSVARYGATVFYDTGAAYDVGQSLRQARFRHGTGVGLFLKAPPILQLQLDLARNMRGGARLHLGAAVSF